MRSSSASHGSPVVTLIENAGQQKILLPIGESQHCANAFDHCLRPNLPFPVWHTLIVSTACQDRGTMNSKAASSFLSTTSFILAAGMRQIGSSLPNPRISSVRPCVVRRTAPPSARGSATPAWLEDALADPRPCVKRPVRLPPFVPAGCLPRLIGDNARCAIPAGSAETIPLPIARAKTSEIRCRIRCAVSIAPRSSTGRKHSTPAAW